MAKSFPARGFTLIELLVTISLTAIVGSFGLAYYSSFNRRQIVEQAAKKIVSDIRLAQNLALSQQKPDPGDCTCTTLKSYSFVVDDDEISYKIIPDCSSVCVPEVIVKKVELENVTLSGGLDWIKFTVLSQGVGITPAGGQLIILSKDGSYRRKIVVGDSGSLTIEE